MDYTTLIISLIAALFAGFVNAIAGGGTLITFPILIALGIPPVAANVTNTTALVPGLIGGIWAQRKDFSLQKWRILRLLPITIIGGLFGGFLLLNCSETYFSALVPYLILSATALLIIQPTLKKWLNTRLPHSENSKIRHTLIFILLIISAIYGGYFGAGLGIILMAILGLSYNNSLVTINVLKQALAFSINLSAFIFFIFSDQIIWHLALIMLIGAISGGYIGGKVVNKMNSNILRWIIIIVGIGVGVTFLIK